MYKTLVVGAGFTGLIAAHQLAQAGQKVLVLEARQRLGGRAFSFVPELEQTSGHALEFGATWFWHNEPLIADLAQKLGVETFAQDLAGDALFENPQTGLQRLQGNQIDMESSRFTFGAQQLAEKLGEQLVLSGGEIRLGEPVLEVKTGDGVARVTTAVASYEAEHVLLAIPPALSANITFSPELPAALEQAANSTATWMGDMIKAVAVYPKAFWKEMGLAGSVFSLSGLFNEFHNHSGADGAPPAIFAFARASRFETDEQAKKAFLTQLVRYFGPVAEQDVEVHLINWSREEFTSLANPNPSASTSYGNPIFSEAVNERIFFASTETADAYGGHMEGALRAGLLVAQRILAA